MSWSTAERNHRAHGVDDSVDDSMQPRPSVQRREVGAAAPRHQQWIPVCRWAGSPDRAQLSSTVGRIRAAAPEVAIVMLTMINDSEVLATAIRAGAVGYVLKDAEQEELLHVIQAAARGELLFGASVAERARLLLHPKTGPWSPPLPELSDRERSILEPARRRRTHRPDRPHPAPEREVRAQLPDRDPSPARRHRPHGLDRTHAKLDSAVDHAPRRPR